MAKQVKILRNYVNRFLTDQHIKEVIQEHFTVTRKKTDRMPVLTLLSMIGLRLRKEEGEREKDIHRILLSLGVMQSLKNCCKYYVGISWNGDREKRRHFSR